MQTVQAIDTTRARLQEHLNILHQEALLNRAIFQQGKAAGLAGLVLGGIGCLAFPPLGIVSLASGIGLWAATALTEGSITGNLCPLPWVSTRLTDLAAGLDRQNAGQQIEPQDLELTDYLPPHDRVAYLLILCQGNKLAEILGQLEPAQLEATFAAIVQKMIKIYGSHGLRLEEAMKESAEAIAHTQAQFQQLKVLPPTLGKQPPIIQPEPKAKSLAEVLPEPVMSKAIGNATRLGAIAVEPLPDTDDDDVWAMPSPVLPSVGSMANTEQPQPDAYQQPDITDFIIEQGNSLVFLGGQGVGKSRLMAITSQRGLEQGKYKHVTALSGLAKANEDPIYWQHCVNQLFFDLAPMNDRDRELALAKQLKAIQDFKSAANSENPGLLILDEIAFQAALLARSGEHTVQYALQKEITDILRVVCSGGAKRGWFVWVGTPQGAIGDMGDIGRAIKKLKPVCCAIAPMSVVKSRGHSTTWDEGLYQAAKLNFPALSFPPSTMSDHIVFFDGRWLPQTRYELQAAKVPESVQPTEPVKA